MPKCEEGSIAKSSCLASVDSVPAEAQYVCSECSRYVCDLDRSNLIWHTKKTDSSACQGSWIPIKKSNTVPSEFKPRVIAYVDIYRFVQVSPDVIKVEKKGRDLIGEPCWTTLADETNKKAAGYTASALVFALLEMLDNLSSTKYKELPETASDAEQRFALIEPLDEPLPTEESEEEIPF